MGHVGTVRQVVQEDLRGSSQREKEFKRIKWGFERKLKRNGMNKDCDKIRQRLSRVK